jgi:hypothetical protein
LYGIASTLLFPDHRKYHLLPIYLQAIYTLYLLPHAYKPNIPKCRIDNTRATAPPHELAPEADFGSYLPAR